MTGIEQIVIHALGTAAVGLTLLAYTARSGRAVLRVAALSEAAWLGYFVGLASPGGIVVAVIGLAQCLLGGFASDRALARGMGLLLLASVALLWWGGAGHVELLPVLAALATSASVLARDRWSPFLYLSALSEVIWAIFGLLAGAWASVVAALAGLAILGWRAWRLRRKPHLQPGGPERS